MSTLTVTAKGQVTLPKNLLKHLGVRPGEKIAVAKLPGGRLVVSGRPTGKISDVFGLLKKKDDPSLSIEDINGIAAEGWAGKRWWHSHGYHLIIYVADRRRVHDRARGECMNEITRLRFEEFSRRTSNSFAGSLAVWVHAMQ